MYIYTRTYCRKFMYTLKKCGHMTACLHCICLLCYGRKLAPRAHECNEEEALCSKAIDQYFCTSKSIDCLLH